MIKAEFGVIDRIDLYKDDSKYEPEKYSCIAIDDNYLNDWWPRLMMMKTYFHSLQRPEFGLARWGITLIPPESLRQFEDIVLSSCRMKYDRNLAELAAKIGRAAAEGKYMIHFGI